MSSRFNSPSMLNKTPPVCQKHEPGPELPPNTIWPSLKSIITVYNPTAETSEIWTQEVIIPRIGPGLIYVGETLDTRGFNWKVQVRLEPGYNGLGIDVFVENVVPEPFGQIFPDREIEFTFPLDTGQQELEDILNASRITARIIV